MSLGKSIKILDSFRGKSTGRNWVSSGADYSELYWIVEQIKVPPSLGKAIKILVSFRGKSTGRNWVSSGVD